MEKTITIETVCDNDDERLRQLYMKVVTEPNYGYLKKGFIKCPECGEEILLLLSLRMMNDAIENHVKAHKKLLKANTLLMHSKSIDIRLDLAQQVLLQASRSLE